MFGPAYKGIPLVAVTAAALAERHQIDLPYCFNRKETKDHGEGGNLVGAPLNGRVLLIDDVITAGTAIREVMPIIETAGAQLVGIIIALDRQEQGQTENSAITEIEHLYGIAVKSIINLNTLMSYLKLKFNDSALLKAMQTYQEQYGTP